MVIHDTQNVLYRRSLARTHFRLFQLELRDAFLFQLFEMFQIMETRMLECALKLAEMGGNTNANIYTTWKQYFHFNDFFT